MTRMDETETETVFCVLAARGVDPADAARKAGFPDPERRAALLLGTARIRRKIARLRAELSFCSPEALARAGLERIALGDASGAIALLNGEDGGIERADLFHVTEVKKPKGGGIEIKFCDRLGALAQLAGLEGEASVNTGSLLAALAKSSQIPPDDPRGDGGDE